MNPRARRTRRYLRDHRRGAPWGHPCLIARIDGLATAYAYRLCPHCEPGSRERLIASVTESPHTVWQRRTPARGSTPPMA